MAGNRWHSNDYLAREHIYPKSAGGALADYKGGLQLRRLGNFMLLPQGVNSSLSDGMPADKLDGLDRCGLQNALLVQNKRLKSLLARAATFRAVLESRKDATFGSTRATRFNRTSIEPNGIVAEAKTLCDLREERMVRFALHAWRMPGEELGEREGERFIGVFSFRFEDETYLSDKERPATKENANYVLERAPDAGLGNARLRHLETRLARRNELLESSFQPVSWSEVREGVRKAA